MKKNLLLKNNFFRLSAVLLLLFLPLSCSKAKERSPSDTVRSYYTAANSGNYTEVEELLSTDVLNALSKQFKIISIGTENLIKFSTKNMTIEKIDILEEIITGNEAIVYFAIDFKDGSFLKDREALIKEDGVWKITIALSK